MPPHLRVRTLLRLEHAASKPMKTAPFLESPRPAFAGDAEAQSLEGHPESWRLPFRTLGSREHEPRSVQLEAAGKAERQTLCRHGSRSSTLRSKSAHRQLRATPSLPILAPRSASPAPPMRVNSEYPLISTTYSRVRVNGSWPPMRLAACRPISRFSFMAGRKRQCRTPSSGTT